MATETGYNGWTNYETWVVKLWIDNDEGEQDYWLEQARKSFTMDYQLAAQLQESFTENFYEAFQIRSDTTNVYTDLMSHALARVDWQEIAESLIEGAQEVPA